jgi:hypothetical protein
MLYSLIEKNPWIEASNKHENKNVPIRFFNSESGYEVIAKSIH